MKRPAKLAIISVSALAVILAVAYVALRELFPVATLTAIRKTSPDRLHSAELVTQEDGFDVNVVLRVDGDIVYTSPDFAAPATADFRERVMWDRSSTIVVLEVAEKRLFGYHIRHRRPLSDAELLAVQLHSFDDLRFTEDLPTSTSAHTTR